MVLVGADTRVRPYQDEYRSPECGVRNAECAGCIDHWDEIRCARSSYDPSEDPSLRTG
jgi:hypothetical protein